MIMSLPLVKKLFVTKRLYALTMELNILLYLQIP